MLLLLAALPAHAGIEPTSPWRYHARAQAQLAHRPGWSEFRLADGEGWFARFDEHSGLVHRAWGPGIPLGELSDEAATEAAFRRFVDAHPALFGVGSAQLRLRSIGRQGERWYLDFARVIDGVPVYREGVKAIFHLGGLVWFSARTWPEASLPAPEISAREAIRIFELEGPASLAEHRGAGATLVAVPWEEGDQVELRLAWEVRSETRAPLGRWVAHVDAIHGQLLAVDNEIRSLDGTITGSVYERTYNDPLVELPMPEILIETDAGEVAADDEGAFSADGDGVVRLRSDYVTVVNQSGDEGELPLAESTHWTTDHATQAEISTYRYVYDVREWCFDLELDNAYCTDPLRATVNRTDGTCNAYFDGQNINFYEEGDGCNNTGQIADVVYHEWGHGLHYFGVEAGSIDGSVSEGIGDTVAAFLTLSPELAPYFYDGWGGPLRECETDYAWPDDVAADTHQTGLIFAGAMWDLFKTLAAAYGESETVKGEGWATASRLLAGAIRSGPTIPESFDAVVAADDDDGDLSNGTPHICEIIDAFAPHGLGTGADGGGLYVLDHTPVEGAEAGVSVSIEGSASSIAPECTSGLAGVDVYWSTDEGANWERAAADFDGERFSAALGGFGEGTVVWYYVQLVDDSGDGATLPTHGAIAPYTFYVGTLTELWCSDFEDDDGGFTHELVDGDDQAGADDWMWKAPNGSAVDPTVAWSGEKVWGNDLGGTDDEGNRYNGEYQPEIVNRLTSPVIDTQGQSRVVLQYRRWLQVEDGFYDVATVYANEEPVWVNHGTNVDVGDEDTLDDEWMLHSLVLEDAADGLSLAWELSSDSGKELGGWTLDDVCVYAIADLSWAGVADFSASDDQVGTVQLRWTQPADSRASSAVVVRRTDRYAASKDDGDVVYEGEVTPGTVIEVDDPYTGTAWYSVFAGSSAGWGTGATEGENADLGKGLGSDEAGVLDDKTEIGDSVCACASSDPRLLSLFGVLGAISLARRRR